MFYFLSRRVSVAPIFVWSAVTLLSTMPGLVGAIPIEARLAEIIGANHFMARSGCNVHSCKFIEPNKPQADLSESPTSTPTPTPSVANAPAVTVTPDESSSPEKSDPPPFIMSPETTPEQPSRPEPASQDGPVDNVAQTGGAIGRSLNFSPTMMWLMACTAGAAMAAF